MPNEKILGQGGNSYTGGSASQYLYLAKFVAPVNATAKEIRFLSTVQQTGQLGIYADSGGEPGSRLYQWGYDAIGGSGWQTHTMTGDVAIVKDNVYWIGGGASTGGSEIVYYGVAGLTLRYKSWAWYNTLPNPAGGGFTTLDDYTLVMELWGIVEAPSGWPNIGKVNGVAAAGISKINGVPVADIAKLKGITV